MHQPVESDYAEPTRDKLIADLMKLNRKAMRCPRHWVDRLAGIHAYMDHILTQLEMLAELEAMDADA